MSYNTDTLPGFVEENQRDIGRQALNAWMADQPGNWFDADLELRRTLQRLWGKRRFSSLAPSLSQTGVRLAQLEPLVMRMERQGNQPQLDRWDGVGNRIEDVEYDGRYRDVGKVLYGTGVVSLLGEHGNVLQSAVLGYLSNQLGEAGHNCPIVCTAGLVRALRAAGSSELKQRYLPGLLNAYYDTNLTGAQFMTDVQGGSDVGSNAVIAMPIMGEQGKWRITGEKWFCSNVTADLILLTARPGGPGHGTKGLSLFLVPRILPDGTLNNFHVRRLKEKLGTRAMASGEIDFEGCIGWNVGRPEEGFKTMMTNVINTSRLYNASGTLGMARRAYAWAYTYARNRGAFGKEIINYPLVQETLADMRSETAVLLAGHLHLAHLRDRLDLGKADDADAGFYRVALNLNKYRTCVSAGEVIRSAIEILGGNGAIESFSTIPRLLRDNVVYENWEGTHNTLAMQVLRDMARLGVGVSFMDTLGRRFAALSKGPMKTYAGRGGRAVLQLAGEISELSNIEPALAGLRMRSLCDRMSWLMAGAAYAEQAVWDAQHVKDKSGAALLNHFWTRRLDGRPVSATQKYMQSLPGLLKRL